MLITKKIEIIWKPQNKKYYESKGYNFTKYNDIILINIDDLHPGSRIKVECYCDYCLENNIETIINKPFCRYLEQHKHINKDCCNNPQCTGKKMQDIMQLKYGVNSPFALDEIKQKTIETNIKKFGVNHPLQLEEFQQKRKNTCIKNLGVDSPIKNIKIKEKIKNTMLERYGVEYAIQNEEICNIIQNKRMKKMSENNSVPKSKQREYIYNLLGGSSICKLNYPFSRCWLDIAFPEEMIYIEYDGKDHNLNVILGNITQEEFDKNQMLREEFLKTNKWKRISIISNTDLLPNDNIIIEMISLAKKYLNSGHSWIQFYIDDNIVRCSQYNKNYDFKELRKIKE